MSARSFELHVHIKMPEVWCSIIRIKTVIHSDNSFTNNLGSVLKSE